MSFKKNVSITFGTKIFTLILTRTLNIVLARILGPAGKGIYTIVTLLPQTLFAFSSLGFVHATTYFVSKKRYKLDIIASNVFTLGLIIGCTGVIGTIIVINNFQFKFLKGISPLLLILGLFSLPFSLIRSYYSSILLGTERIKAYNIMEVSSESISLFLFLILCVFFNKAIINAIVSFLIGTISSCIITVILIRRRIRLVLNYQFLKEGFEFGIKAYGTYIITFLQQRVDIFLVNYFLTLEDVGYYSLAVGMGELLYFVPRSISTILFPKIASISSEEAKKFTPEICRHAFFITLISAFLLILFGKIVIIVLYGKIFLPSFPLLLLSLPGVVIFSISRILLGDLLGRGKPIYGTISAAVGLIMMVTLDILLLPKMGVIGASIAASISYIIISMLVIVFYLKISGNNFLSLFNITFDELKVYKHIIKKGLRM